MRALINGQPAHVVGDYGGTDTDPLGGVVVRLADNSELRVPFLDRRLVIEPTDRQLARAQSVTLAAAAERLGLSPSTLRHQIHAGQLHGRLIGKTWTVSEREVERYRRDSLGRKGRRPK